MEKTDLKIELYTALSEFQAKCPSIGHDSKGYSYKYASLSNIVKTINPVMSKAGLGFTQLILENKLKTIVFHCKTGQTIESTLEYHKTQY